MNCSEKFRARMKTAGEPIKVGPEEVDGRSICDHPGCGKRLRGDGTCVDGHVQGSAAALRPPEELGGMLCLAQELEAMGLGEFIHREREEAQGFMTAELEPLAPELTEPQPAEAGAAGTPRDYRETGTAGVRALVEAVDRLDEYTESFTDIDADELALQMARAPRLWAARDFLLREDGVTFTQPSERLRAEVQPLLYAVHGYEAADNLPEKLYGLALQINDEYTEWANAAEQLGHTLRRIVARGYAAGLLGEWGAEAQGGLDTPEMVLADLYAALQGEAATDWEAVPDQFERLAGMLDEGATASADDPESGSWYAEQAAAARHLAAALRPIYQRTQELVVAPPPITQDLRGVMADLAAAGLLKSTALPHDARGVRQRMEAIDDLLTMRQVGNKQRQVVYSDQRVGRVRQWLLKQSGFLARGSPVTLKTTVRMMLAELRGAGYEEDVITRLDRAYEVLSNLGYHDWARGVGGVASKMVSLRHRAGVSGLLRDEAAQGGTDTAPLLAADLWQAIRQDVDGEFVPDMLTQAAERVEKARVRDDFELEERRGRVARELEETAALLRDMYERLTEIGGPQGKRP